jgi:Ca2+-transporting ATPase
MTGLSTAEATRRLAAEGPNELPQPDRRTGWRIFLEVLHEPMLALLLAGGLIYLVIGDLGEALLLLVFACLSVFITVVQETRTGSTLSIRRRASPQLMEPTSPTALASSRAPELRGLKKCSLTFSE